MKTTVTMISLSVVLACLTLSAQDNTRHGDHSFTIKVGDLQRHYIVHVPPQYDSKTPVPVVVMLHGGGGTGKAAAEETGWDIKADKEGFLAVFPDAMARDPGKPGSFARNPQLWNDGSDRFYPGQKAPDDIAFLNAMLDELCANFSVDTRRIFVTGFSNGASMTFRFGAEASRRVAAIAPVAGACWLEKLALERPVPMCYLTGTADPLNLIEGGVPKMLGGGSDKVRAKPKPPVRESIRKWTDAVGSSATPTSTTETNGVHSLCYGSDVVFITVAGQGHTWAGGKSLLPEFMVGKTTDKLNATDFIWEFFKKHTLPEDEFTPLTNLRGHSAAEVVKSCVPAIDAKPPDPAAMKLAQQYSESSGGQTMLVLHEGRTIFEAYGNGGEKDLAQTLASGSKSFVGVAALAAIEDGLIQLDEPVSNVLTEWKDDPVKSKITYRQLLTLTSGLLPGERSAAMRSPSWKEIIAKPMSGQPGEQFEYGAYHLIAFCEALQRKLGNETFEAYLKRRVLDPIGITVEWRGRCADGQPQVGGGARMTARDWAAFGQFVLNNGEWNGKQILRADLFDLLKQATPQNPAYGLTWWLKADVPDSIIATIPILQRDMGDIAASDWLPDDLFMAAGAGKQRLYIIPSMMLVIVRQGDLMKSRSFSDAEFLNRLLRGNANDARTPE